MARRPEQGSLYEELPPVRAGSPLFCHQEFLEKMEENRNSTVGRRAALLLQRLLVDVHRQFYKSTQGENRGWRRSPLGGNHGFHFYAWWAPRGAVPLKGSTEFEEAPEGSVFLRDIRHHDDHRPLNPQSKAENYLPIGVPDLRRSEYVPSPWTGGQSQFARNRQKVRVIKGFPGSGKTTALWHAADTAGRQSILYVTYSPELAALARDHFDKFAPGQKRFQVITYAELLRRLVGTEGQRETVRERRAAFVREVSGFSPTILGPWYAEKGALYDELHAHYVGGVLPVAIGRFAAFPDRRITARHYRDWRERSIGRAAAEAAVEVADTLRRRDSRPLEERYFGELDLAWRAVQQIQARGAGTFAEVDCIAVDEAQDLTPIESLVLVELAGKIKDVTFLAAGDEAQTVRPTDFEWGWFQDLLHYRLGSPATFTLDVNLRSPRRIATLVNHVWDLYGAIAKRERPGGSGLAEIDDNTGDQVLYCTAKAGPELDELLQAFGEREGIAMITLGDEVPGYVPAAQRDRVLTAFEAKGLDFQSVCLLDGGKWLSRVMTSAHPSARGSELEDLTKRLSIDQLRVALSRPSERLYWLDVNPGDSVLKHSQALLQFGADHLKPMVPAVLLKNLEEETLDAEERVRLCQADARQYLAVKPGLAWSRARQAVDLLGELGSRLSVMDLAARESAHMTLCEVSFTLAMRKSPLPSELGRIDLFGEAVTAARWAGKAKLSLLLTTIAEHEKNYGTYKTGTLMALMAGFRSYRESLEPWLLMELQPSSAGWIRALEDQVELMPEPIVASLIVMYELFDPGAAAARTQALHSRAIRGLMRDERYEAALRMLKETDGDRRLIAECLEGVGQLAEAAAGYLETGRPNDALRCYRNIPDFEKSLELLAAVEGHPARESLEWLRRMRELSEQRPSEFNKVMLPAEKKLLEQVLETALGVSRKKAAPRKAAGTKGKPAAKKAVKPKPLF